MDHRDDTGDRLRSRCDNETAASSTSRWTWYYFLYLTIRLLLDDDDAVHTRTVRTIRNIVDRVLACWCNDFNTTHSHIKQVFLFLSLENSARHPVVIQSSRAHQTLYTSTKDDSLWYRINLKLKIINSYGAATRLMEVNFNVYLLSYQPFCKIQLTRSIGRFRQRSTVLSRWEPAQSAPCRCTVV